MRTLIVALLAFAAASGWAADQTWDGGSGADSDWSTNQNWGNNAEPNGTADGATMDGSTRLTPNLDIAVTLNRLTFAAGAGNFTIGGTNALTMGGTSPVIEVLAGSQTISSQFALAANLTIYVAPGATLTISDASITGAFLITKVGSGTLTVTDSAAAVAPTFSAPASDGLATSDSTPTWTWSAGTRSGVFRYRLNGGGWTDTTATSFTPGVALGNGSQTLEVAEYSRLGVASAAASRAWLVSVDGTPPFVASRLTRDLDGDGLLDAIDVVFSESMDQGALRVGVWTVSGYAVGTPTWTGAASLRLPLTEGQTADTGALPTVRYVQAGSGAASAADAAGNLLATEAVGTVASDGAGPVVVSVSANAGSDELTVTFSEPVRRISGGGSLVVADLVYTDTTVGGASALAAINDGNGTDSVVTVRTNAAVAAADLNSDTVRPAAAAIEDLSGNAASLVAVQLVTPTPFFLSTIGGGDWHNVATWVEGRLPNQFDNVQIVGPVTVGVGQFGDCATLTFSGNGALSSTGDPQAGEFSLIRLYSGTNQVTALDDTTITNIQLWDRKNFGATYDIVFTVASNSTLTLNNQTQGQWARTVVKRGGGTLVWNAPAALYDTTFDDGPTRVEAGVFRLIRAGGRPGNFEISVSGGATLDLRVDQAASNLTGQGTIRRGAAGTTILTLAGSSWGGRIEDGSGSLQLSVTGANAWSGTNAFTGGLTIGTGSLTVTGTTAIDDACPVTVAVGGTLVVGAAETVGPVAGGGAITLNAALTIDHATGTGSFSGTIAGAAALTIAGQSGGAQYLTGSSTHTGGTILSGQGNLGTSTNAAIGAAAGALTFAGGRLTLLDHLNMTAAAVQSTNDGSFPSAALAVETSTVPADRPISVTSAGGTIAMGSWSLAVPGFSTAVGQDLTIIGNGTTSFASTDPALFVVVAPATTATWAGRLDAGSAFGFLCKRGAGTLAITNGANTWSKRIIRSEEGTLAFGASGSLGPVADWVYILPGAVGRLDGVIYASAPTLYLSGTLGVSGTSSWQGPTNLWSGTPVIDVAAAGQMTLAGSVSQSSATSLGKSGPGRLVMGAANTFALPVAVTAGTLSVSADSGLGNAANALTLSNGGTLETTASFTSSRAIALGAGGGTISAGDGTILVLSGTVSGQGLAKQSAGTLVLQGANSHASTTIGNGVLQIAANGNLGTAAGPVTLDGGTLRCTASAVLSGRPFAITASGGSCDVTAGVCEIDGALSGSGQLVKAGSGTLVLSGANAPYTGPIQVAAGMLGSRSANALGSSAAGTTVAEGAALELSGSFTSSEPLSLAGTGIASGGVLISASGTQTMSGAIGLVQTTQPVGIVVASGGTLTLSGTVTGAGGLGKAGAGALVLGSAANAFTGQVTVLAGSIGVADSDRLGNAANEVLLNGGTLTALASFTSASRVVRIGISGGTIDTGAGLSVSLPAIDTAPLQALTLAGTGSLTLSNSGTATLAGPLLGTAALNKGGTGDLLITNTGNALTGLTTVGGGRLLVTGTLPGSVRVAVGGTLSGAGTIGGLLTVQAGGVVSPAGSNAGVLTVGTLDVQASAVLNLNIGTASDLIAVTGASASVAGAIALAGETTAPSGTYTVVSAPNAAMASTAIFSPNPNTATERYRIVATSTQLQIVRDSAAPTITAITSQSPDGDYDNGDAVDIRVVFSEPVVLTGGLRLTLNTTPSATVDIAAGPLALEFSGTYTVAAPEVAADLNVTAIAFLSAGNFADAAGFAVSGALTTPPQNLGALKNIAIVNRAPQMALAAGVAGETQPAAVAIGTRQSRLFHPADNDATHVKVVASDVETSDPADLTYRVLLEPSQGQVQYSADGSFAPAGLRAVVTTVTDGATQVDTFTQADIDAGRVRYEHTALSGGNDAFLMTVTDGDGTVSALYLMRFAIAGNAAPTIAGLPATLTYQEESTHALWEAVAGAVTVTDLSTAFTDGQMTFTVVGATAGSGDELGFLPSATAVSVAAGVLTAAGVEVGPITTTTPYSFTVDFSPTTTAGPAQAEAIIAALAYRNTRLDPDPSVVRSIRITITDGSVGQIANQYTIPLSLELYNDPPVVTVGQPLATVPGLPRQFTVTVSDPEGDTVLAYAIATPPSPQATRGALGQIAGGLFGYTAYYPGSLSDADPLIDSFALTVADSGFDPGAPDPRRQGTAAAATSTPSVYTVRISGGGGLAPRFDAPMRMTVQAGLPFTFQPAVTAAPGAVLSWELVDAPAQLSAAIPATASFDPTTGLLNWSAVPAPTDGSGYHRFSILVTDTVNRTAAVLPVMLRVGPGGVN